MYCIISDGKEILGVMMTRNIEEEGKWKEGELKKMGPTTGMVLYRVDELKQYQEFTKFYGFQLIYDNNGKVVGVTDSEGNLIPNESLNMLDVSKYPELIDSLNI